ncbi:hypothetical protein BJ170DRAFT_677516 [Xylariales sp. AK1849]|nr:hypothetical protein BJ170DRAFT_677516 [Xylariales sp. AK1849]
MSAAHPSANNPFMQSSPRPQHDDWEEWEDDEMPVDPFVGDGLLVNIMDMDDAVETPTASSTRDISRRNSQQRYSVQRPMFRAKSRGHQKEKIAKAGIKLDTNVSNMRQPAKSQQIRAVTTTAQADNAGKFVDAAALKALEGSPNSASVGSFSWLRRMPGNIRSKSVKKHVRGPESDLSPESRPIVIGIAVPEDDLQEHQVSPQTAILETPIGMQNYNQRIAAQRTKASTLTPQQQRSVWSPDTEASSESPRPASSIYSQPSMYGGRPDTSDVPPVPTLPATFRFKQSQPAAFADPDDDDDVGTPCTLFEEDGSPRATRKSFRPRAATVSPQSAETRTIGWWDHITTPFSQQTNPFKQSPQPTSSSSTTAPQEWWQGADEKARPVSRATGLTIVTPASLSQQDTAQTVRSNASSSHSAPVDRQETHSEKARILLEENHAPSDAPPPYSPPKTVNQVKYGAILPPSHVISNQPLPSPGPISPGLPGTMTSQGAINMAEIPLTPRAVPTAVLPDRPIGTYVTQDQFHEAPGTRHRGERQRRRHEKEEFVARKVGGFWRGRGCMPSGGCFGRTGREGRKRRRVCLGIFGGILAAIILIVVLAVVLTRKSMSKGSEHSIWLNLTDFPPMPTGVLTVAGPDNSENVPGCITNNAKTLWSCSIPKDQQDPDSLYPADSPEFIFQIQYDNNTQALWDVSSSAEQPKEAGNDAPLSDRRTVTSAIARAAEVIRRAVVYDAGFSPKPAPPDGSDMFFLGNTTDGIVADNKAGEATPFYISLLSSVDDTVGPDMLTRRGPGNTVESPPNNGTSDGNISLVLPPPELNPDGTGAPARLFPLPSQQPVRLFDRGLPTEHYGFYTYFNKTIYIFDREFDHENSLDEDGGALLKDAKSLVTWSQTRFLVKIWTRMQNTARMLGNGTEPGVDGSSVHAKPGTMPYPVTIAEDYHGGTSADKGTWYYGVDDKQHINTTDAKLILVDRGFGGTWINHYNDADPSLGGIDGGTGGCKCEWVNFVSTES